MNINPETDLDLEKLFLPAWAQDTSSANRYAKYTGNEGAPRERRRDDDRRGPRPPRRDVGRGPGGPRRDEGGRGPGGPGGPRRDGRPGGPPREGRGGPRRDDRRGFGDRERREAPLPLPEINVMLVPDERGVESMARQVKMTGRSFPLFDIAFLILQKPERYSVNFMVKKDAEGKVLQPMFLCALDETLWLSEEEVVAHVLSRHFGTFYQAERTATEPPKGTYTFVAQCGMSGAVLGPPNHHDYQNQLRKLHADRFSRMPFDVYKARVKIVRDEAVVKKWVEEQSWKTEYVCLNVPEPLKLPNREEVEKHFRATHKESIIKSVETQTVSGVGCRALRGGPSRLVQDLLSEQRRFPMQIATALSQAFAKYGLQFFKVNKSVTHVCVARPQYLDMEATPVSEGVRRIVEFIGSHPKCSRRTLIEGLAPSPPPAPIPVVPATPAPVVQPPEGSAPEASAAAAPAAPAAPKAPAAPEPTSEQTAVIADLHWLVHQGHVIEFANGMLDTAKKPLPKPPKPEKKAPVVPPEAVAPAEPLPTAESGPVPTPEASTQPAETTAPEVAGEANVVVPTSSESIPAASNLPAENSPQPPGT